MTMSRDADLAHALAILARAPDPAAWALVLERTGPAMEALAHRLTGDAELARDAVQEALLQVRDHAAAFRPPIADHDRAARSWILRVTANTALMLARGQARRRRRERTVPPHRCDHAAPADSRVEAGELAECVRAELAKLPEPQRAAIALRHCAGLAFGEVAAALGIPEGTAKVRAHRGMRTLRGRLVRAGITAPLLAATILPERLTAGGESPSPFTATTAARHLLDSRSTSRLPFLHQGYPMTTLTALAGATTLMLIGGLSLLLSQDATAPIPPPAMPPAPAAKALVQLIEIRPGAITRDPAAWTCLDQPRRHRDGDDTWNNRLCDVDARGFARPAHYGLLVDLGTVPKTALLAPCRVPPGASWKVLIAALADELNETWRMRGSTVEFVPSGIAAKLATRLDGTRAPSGTRTQVLAWFAAHTGLSVRLLASLGTDDGRMLKWSAQEATQEAWVEGLAEALQATALLEFDGSLSFYRAPAVIPLVADPALVTAERRLAYRLPPPARLDAEITCDFIDLPLLQAVDRLKQSLHYPVEVDATVSVTEVPPVTLRVEDMKAAHAIDFMAKITGLEVRILPDRVLLPRPAPAQPPVGADPPAPSAAQ